MRGEGELDWRIAARPAWAHQHATSPLHSYTIAGLRDNFFAHLYCDDIL